MVPEPAKKSRTIDSFGRKESRNSIKFKGLEKSKATSPKISFSLAPPCFVVAMPLSTVGGFMVSLFFYNIIYHFHGNKIQELFGLSNQMSPSLKKKSPFDSFESNKQKELYLLLTLDFHI